LDDHDPQELQLQPQQLHRQVDLRILALHQADTLHSQEIAVSFLQKLPSGAHCNKRHMNQTLSSLSIPLSITTIFDDKQNMLEPAINFNSSLFVLAKYYQCTNAGFVAMPCSADLVWNPVANVCDFTGCT
jgi:hypothetical protein